MTEERRRRLVKRHVFSMDTEWSALTAAGPAGAMRGGLSSSLAVSFGTGTAKPSASLSWILPWKPGEPDWGEEKEEQYMEDALSIINGFVFSVLKPEEGSVAASTKAGLCLLSVKLEAGMKNSGVPRHESPILRSRWAGRRTERPAGR